MERRRNAGLGGDGARCNGFRALISVLNLGFACLHFIHSANCSLFLPKPGGLLSTTEVSTLISSSPSVRTLCVTVYLKGTGSRQETAAAEDGPTSPASAHIACTALRSPRGVSQSQLTKPLKHAGRLYSNRPPGGNVTQQTCSRLRSGGSPRLRFLFQVHNSQIREGRNRNYGPGQLGMKSQEDRHPEG